MVGIYKFTNLINGHVYIGQSVDIQDRYRKHLTRSFNNFLSNTEYDRPIHRAIRKYGIENFSFEVIEECKKEELNEREIYWIEFYNSTERGYNISKGGSQGPAIIKYDKELVEKIQLRLLNSNDSYDIISKELDVSTGRISEINTGKIGFSNNLNYPLRDFYTKNYCIDCGIEIQRSSKRCRGCNNIYLRIPIEKLPITREELKKLIRTKTFVQIGKDFNLTDNSIRKWCEKFNLPRTKKEINFYSDEEWENI